MELSNIARIRRFNRAVAVEIGALDTSFFGRGRPLGAARMLHAVGAGGADVGTLRKALKLDSGLASRLLRGLEGEGLITVTTDPTDRRRRIVRPTKAGLAEIAAYDRLSDDRAARLLAGRGRGSETLLAAMDLVATALGQDRIEIAETRADSPDGRACLAAYYADLASRLDAGFDRAQSLDPAADEMAPPRGAFLVARSDGLAIGCVGLKTAGAVGEVKRLWVSPAARGLGLGRRLMDAIEARATRFGVERLRLDTNRALGEAMALYRATGWAEVPAFNAEPYAHHWFEKRLSPTPPL